MVPHLKLLRKQKVLLGSRVSRELRRLPPPLRALELTRIIYPLIAGQLACIFLEVQYWLSRDQKVIQSAPFT
jgi:hypothetical protein